MDIPGQEKWEKSPILITHLIGYETIKDAFQHRLSKYIICCIVHLYELFIVFYHPNITMLYIAFLAYFCQKSTKLCTLINHQVISLFIYANNEHIPTSPGILQKSRNSTFTFEGLEKSSNFYQNHEKICEFYIIQNE